MVDADLRLPDRRAGYAATAISKSRSHLPLQVCDLHPRRLSGGEALWALLLTLPITREGTWPERWYELTAGIYYTNVLGLFL